MKPIIGGGDSGGGDPPPHKPPGPLPKPTPTPTPQPPANSVKAGDGSTITWSRTDGTLTFTGSNGAKLVQAPAPGKAPVNQMKTQAVYSQNGATYLTVTYALDLGKHQLSINWVAAQVELTLAMTVPADAKTASALLLVGTASGAKVSWRGTLAPGSTLEPASLAGWPKGALATELASAGYFTPAMQASSTATPAAKPTSVKGAPATHTNVEPGGEWVLSAISAAASFLADDVTGGMAEIVKSVIEYDIELYNEGWIPNSETETPWTFTPDPPNSGPDAGIPTTDNPDGGTDDGDGDGGDAGGGCFVGTTLVRLERGHVPIAEVAVRDAIWAFDTDAGAPALRGVDKKWEVAKTELVVLGFEAEEIRCTPPHRFYIGDGRWRAAGDLAIGDRVLASDGRWHVLVSHRRDAGEHVVYNLSVAHTHTYLVGRSELVVHNVKTNGGDTGDGGGDDDDE